jgi:hypothetical protein
MKFRITQIRLASVKEAQNQGFEWLKNIQIYFCFIQVMTSGKAGGLKM